MKKITPAILVATTCIASQLLAQAAQPNRATLRFRDIGSASDPSAAAKKAIGELKVRAGDPDAIDQLAQLISDKAIWNQARWQLVDTLLSCAEGSSGAMDRFVLRFQEWMDRPVEDDDGLKYALSSIVPHLSREPFASGMCRAPRAAEYVKTGYLHDPDSRAVWIRLFGCLPSSKEKSAAALSIIVLQPLDAGVPRELEVALDDRARAELLKLAEPKAEWRLFHVAAAKVLTDLGEERVRPSVTAMTAIAATRHEKDACHAMLERLDLQRTNERLLEFIGGGELQSPNENNRIWALGRSLDRGIPRQAIRTALENYRSNMGGVQLGSEAARRRLIGSIRTAAVQLSILDSQEWSEYAFPGH